VAQKNSGSSLPPRIVTTIACVVLGLLVYNIIADVTVSGYDGYPTTLMLGGLLGGMLGFRNYLKRGGGDDDE
jgi:hypothetical protein